MAVTTVPRLDARTRRLVLGLTLASFCITPRAHAQVAEEPSPALKTGEWTYVVAVLKGTERSDAGRRVVTVERMDFRNEPAWRVTGRVDWDETQTSDRVYMGTTLDPLTRVLDLGAARASIEVEGRRAKGQFAMAGGSRPIDVKIAEGTFLNYYSLRAALTTWAVAPSWKRRVDIIELSQSGVVVKAALSVEGEERLEVPAGTFDCWKLRLAAGKNGDKLEDFYWLAKDGSGVVQVLERFAGGPDLLEQRLHAFVPRP